MALRLSSLFQELIDLIGIEATAKLIRYYGGTRINIPTSISLEKQLRNIHIRELYLNQKDEHITQDDLGRRFGVTPEDICHLLGSNEERYRPENMYADRVYKQILTNLFDVIKKLD